MRTRPGDMPETVSDPGQLAAIAKHIASGELSPTELVESYLTRIDAVDAQVQAWLEVDRDAALCLARMREKEATQGTSHGALHGVPIAVKDIIDVEGLPTRCNSHSRKDVAPATADAEIIQQLKVQGAIILGKVHTTEFAYFDPSPTRNPWNTAHTPGGSSSGSGAAVAAGMVPLALGTQTIASVNRPAAYCGVSAFKPSGRSMPTFGVAPLAASYDTVGFLAGRVEDAIYAFEAVAPPFLSHPDNDAGNSPLRIALVDDPLIHDMAADMKAAYRSMADILSDAGHCVEDRRSNISFERLVELQKSTLIYEAASFYGSFLALPDGQIGERFLEIIREGHTMRQGDYLQWRAELAHCGLSFLSAHNDIDVFLWPATPSGAPTGLQWTGEPRYIAPWTAIGGPILTVPAGLGDDGLPLACIACSAPGTDLAMCQWGRQLARVAEVNAFDR